jgi:K+-transporting ATPase ATPase B chain
MIAMVEGAKRTKTPNEIALDILLMALTFIFLLATITLDPFTRYAARVAHGVPVSVPVLIALLVCLIPTTIGGLLSAIGIAGMERMVRANVLATSGRAVEAAGDISVLLLDKTGTITLGNRQAVALYAAATVTESRLAWAAHRASLADETPEGRSILALISTSGTAGEDDEPTGREEAVPFRAETRMSGVDLTQPDGTVVQVRKGATDAVRRWLATFDTARRAERTDMIPAHLLEKAEEIAREGGTPLVVAQAILCGTHNEASALGVIHLKDIVKPGISARFSELRARGIRTVMITGDNPLTAVVDLDSNPTKLIEVVTVGKQMLVTRGALTTFSLANDVAKYFAILPAAFATTYPNLRVLDVMHLASPHSAILAAVIFNALILVALVPLALRGVTVRAASADAVLARNLLVFGVGGVVAPFIGIKGIDLLLVALHLT